MRRIALLLLWFPLVVSACRSSERKLPAADVTRSEPALALAKPAPTITPAPKEGSVFGLHPYFTLQVTTAAVPYSVFINGGFVTSDQKARDAKQTWPVNPFMTTGPNEIAVELTQWAGQNGQPDFFGQDAAVTLTLLVRPSGVEDAEDMVVSTLRFHYGDGNEARMTEGSTPAGSYASDAKFERRAGGDVRIQAPSIGHADPDGSLLVSQTVGLDLRFPYWAFLSSEALANVYPKGNAEQRADYPLVFAAYEEIWNKLAAHDVDGLMPLFEERSRENDEAFYFPLGTTQDKLRKQFEEELANSSQELGPIALTKKTQWMYDPGPTGRLRRMVFGSRNGAIIAFIDKEDPTYMTQFPIAFRKQAGRYIISR